MSSELILKPCPACGGPARYVSMYGFAGCPNPDCQVAGPNNDPDGAKWNALPRREAAPELTRSEQYQEASARG